MITKQGFNGPIWALLALNCSPDYTIPKVSGVTNQTTEQKLIDYLVAGEIPGGGWALMGDEADTDITAMTLQALAPYYNEKGYEKVTAAIDRALDRLSEMQLSTGGFGTMGVETLESNAQVITALAALGIDPETDARFIKNGKWTVENLISYHIDNSGFMHVKEGSANNGGGEAGKVNGMATEQGFYALVAYQRMLDGKTSLYDMSDLTTSVGGKGDGTGTGITDPKDQENPSDTNNPGSSTGTNGSGSNSSGNGNIGSGNSNAGNGSTGTNSDGSNSSGYSSTGTNSTGTSSTGNNNSGNASGKDTTYVASTGNGASSGKTTGKTASGSVGAAASSETKKSDENGETQETEEPWSFDGENYVANSSDTEIPDSVTSDEVEPETAGSQGSDGTAVNSIFASENIPYMLCILCGVAVVGVCIYFKRKKPGNTDGQQ